MDSCGASLLAVFDPRLAYTKYLLQDDMWSIILNFFLFITFLSKKSPSFLQFFNLQATLLRYRGSASSCTLETDEYPWDSSAAPAVTSFCFHTGRCQWHTSYSLIITALCCSGFWGSLTVLYAPSATGRAELNSHPGSCLKSPEKSRIIPCFPDENQEFFPLWRWRHF